jgi:hypothetical protein
MKKSIGNFFGVASVDREGLRIYSDLANSSTLLMKKIGLR